MEKCKPNMWAVVLIVLIAASMIVIGIFATDREHLLPRAEEIVIIILALVANFMYILGGSLILFGSILLAARYIKVKLRTPCRPFGAAPRVTFLTLGLEIFIGAEIINTATTRTMDDFLLLTLTIITRGLIGLILYLEKRWGSQEE